MKSFWSVLVLLAAIAPARALTCTDVRTLTSEQRAYYIKVFNITPAQQERIRHACLPASERKPIELIDDSRPVAIHASH